MLTEWPRFTPHEASIPRRGEVVLWYYTGNDKRYYPTKDIAEAACRIQFPNEDEGARYARIFYHTFTREE